MPNNYSLDLELSSSQYAHINDNAPLSLTGSFTFEGWVNFESLPGSGAYQMIFSKDLGGAGGQRAYNFFLYNNAGTTGLYIEIFQTNATLDQVFYNWTPTVSTWYHIAVSCDISLAAASEFTFYINGSSVGNGSVAIDGSVSSIQDTTASFSIGARKLATPDGYFDGLMNNMRVWSDVRTAQEISSGIYSVYTGTANNLVGSWYSINNNHNDLAGTNNLTAVGSPVFSTNVPFVDQIPRTYMTTNTSFWGG